MKSIVVDDELVNRKKMQKIMEHYGICETFENGNDAFKSFVIAWAEGIPFEIMMLDIDMEYISGVDVLLKIRDLEKQKEVPSIRQIKIIMVTSHSDQDNIVQCVKSGCNDYIIKPFDQEIVRKKLISLGFTVAL
jgi:two-component system, chemotaxis family, chemotaxis protein CheY